MVPETATTRTRPANPFIMAAGGRLPPRLKTTTRPGVHGTAVGVRRAWKLPGGLTAGTGQPAYCTWTEQSSPRLVVGCRAAGWDWSLPPSGLACTIYVLPPSDDDSGVAPYPGAIRKKQERKESKFGGNGVLDVGCGFLLAGSWGRRCWRPLHFWCCFRLSIPSPMEAGVGGERGREVSGRVLLGYQHREVLVKCSERGGRKKLERKEERVCISGRNEVL